MAKKSEAEMRNTTSEFSIANFFKGTKEELDKVVWPTRKQLVSESAAVLLMVTLSASLIYVVDWLFSKLSTVVFESTNQAVSINLIDGLFAWAVGKVF